MPVHSQEGVISEAPRDFAKRSEKTLKQFLRLGVFNIHTSSAGRASLALESGPLRSTFEYLDTLPWNTSKALLGSVVPYRST